MAVRTGKIARLPAKIREELNQRLLDGQPGSKILPWLNSLPAVVAILGENFEGLAVTDNNLSDWRAGGFAEWCRQRERINRTRELAQYAAQQTRANGASIAEGAQAIASGKLLELLETLDEVVEAQIAAADGKGDHTQLSADALVAIAGALGNLRTSEQNDVRLAQNEKKLRQKDDELSLAREKYQRETCSLFLRWHADRQALDVANAEGTNADKIERLGQLMFGETWKPAEPAPPAAQ